MIKKVLAVIGALAVVVVGAFWIMEIAALGLGQSNIFMSLALGVWAVGLLICLVTLVYNLLSTAFGIKDECACEDCDCKPK